MFNRISDMSKLHDRPLCSSLFTSSLVC